MKSKLLVVTYSHIEFYPPTLNALGILSEVFDEIVILQRPFTKDFSLDVKNITLISSGKNISVREQERSSTFRKICFFLKFSLDFYKLILKYKPKMILVYDGMPILSLKIIMPFLGKVPEIWYHNHDVYEKKYLKKYTLSWFAHISHKSVFKYLSIFSLPAVERIVKFKLQHFKGRYFTIPNYPRKGSLKDNLISTPPSEKIKFIFQGSVGTGHGIEDFIEIIRNKVNGKSLELVLKGFISEDYKNKLLELARLNGVSDKVFFYGMSSYDSVRQLTLQCHIGIAIFTKNDFMNQTLGTASNKIYEYAASGLPIIYYSNEHFDKYLKNQKWAFGVNIDQESMLSAIKTIDDNYNELSLNAKNSIIQEFNFEKVFEPIIQYLKTN